MKSNKLTQTSEAEQIVFHVLSIRNNTNLMGKRKQVERMSSWKGPEESLAQECEIQIQNFHLMKQCRISHICHQDEPAMVHKWQVLSVLWSVERRHQFY